MPETGGGISSALKDELVVVRYNDFVFVESCHATVMAELPNGD